MVVSSTDAILLSIISVFLSRFWIRWIHDTFVPHWAMPWWNFLLICIWSCKSLYDPLPPQTKYRNDEAKILAGSEVQKSLPSRSIDSDLPQTLLETLFNISRSPEYEPSTMNWRSMVKKMQSLGPAIDVNASSCVQDTYDKGKFCNFFMWFRFGIIFLYKLSPSCAFHQWMERKLN